MSDDLIRRAREALVDVTPGPWEVGARQWPEQVGCCPLVGRPYSVHGTDFYNTAAATTRANARFIAAARDLVPAMADRLEAQEALLREAMDALGMAVDDLDEWVACGDSLAQAGFNVDGTADCAERARATLAKLRAHLDGRADEGGVPNGI